MEIKFNLDDKISDEILDIKRAEYEVDPAVEKYDY